MATLAVFQPVQVEFSGTPREFFNSAPNVKRAFCGHCGTSLTWETVMRGGEKVCALHVSTFDDSEALRPDGHSFYSERLSWFDVADDLPRHAGFVKEGDAVQHGPAPEETLP